MVYVCLNAGTFPQAIRLNLPPPRKDVTYLTVIAAGLYSGPRLLACFVLDFVCVCVSGACAGKYPRPLGGDVIVHTEIK